MVKPRLLQDTTKVIYQKPTEGDTLIKWNAPGKEALSEKSYPPLLTYEETMDLFMGLNCNITWLFYNMCAVNLLYFFLTYELLFDPKLRSSEVVSVAKISCNAVLVMDTFSTILHYIFRNTKKRTVIINAPSAFLIATQVCSLALLPLQMVLIFETNFPIEILLLIALILRYHKLYVYADLLSKIPGQISLWNLYKKHFIIALVVLQSSVCIWMHLGCLGPPEICGPMYDGANTYWNAGPHEDLLAIGNTKLKYTPFHKRKRVTPMQNYILCVYYVTGALTSAGYGGPSLRNAQEEIVCIVLMFIYVIFIYGLANAQLVRYYMSEKNRDFERMERRRAIVEDFDTKNKLRLRLKDRILKYYDEFWENDFGIKKSSLLKVLPRSLFVDTQTEKYWVFLNKCTFLQNTSDAFRRAIACKMYTEVLNKGDVLFEVDTLPETVCYLQRGNVEVLSSVDFESPILALGKGSCLGKTNLLWNSPTKLKVVVASYTMVYFLQKADFWKVASTYYKLHESSAIHKHFREMIRQTHHHLRKRKPKEQTFKKWRCVETKNVLTEFKQKIMHLHHPDKLGVKVHENPRRHYIFSKIHSQKTYDEIFAKITFPWALQHKSQFLDLWNITIIIITIIISLTYPYVAAFSTDVDIFNLDLVTAFYVSDVIVSVITSLDTKNDTIRRVKDIVLSRIERFSFILDIVAALPMHWIYTSDDKDYKRWSCVFNLNKLAKLYKVEQVVSCYERDSAYNSILVKSIKYTFYLAYVGYVLGCIFYMITCFYEPCPEFSWIQAFHRVLLELGVYDPDIEIHDPRKTPFVFCFLNMLSVLSGTCSFLSVNMTEMNIVVFVACLGLLIQMHLFAGYATTYTLQNKTAVQYMEFISTVDSYITDRNLHVSIKLRVLRFLENRWRTNKAISRRKLYKDCPEHLYNMNQIAQYKAYLRHMELLQHSSSEMIDLAASRCSQLLLPPAEYLIYSGQKYLYRSIVLPQSAYINSLHKFLKIVEGSATKKALLPGQCINAMELFMGYPSLVTIRSVTHCLVLKLAEHDVHYIMRKYPINFGTLQGESLDDVSVKRVYTSVKASYLGNYDTTEEGDVSFFKFPKQQRDPLYLDHNRGYQKSKLRFLRYVLLRKTILPYGKFLRRWVIAKAVCAILICLLVPTRYLHRQQFPEMRYFLGLLYTFSLIDIYIRFHICYYNNKGLLVSHPLSTAKHYFCHSFVLDILSIFPIAWLVKNTIALNDIKLENLMNFNVAIQLHRVPDAFRNRSHGIYERNSTWFQCVKYTPLIVIITTLLSCVLLHISGEVRQINGVDTLVISRFSWLTTAGDMKYIDLTNAYNVFLMSFYFTTITLTGVSFNLFTPCNMSEAYFVITCILIGFLMKLYIVVNISHDRYSVDHKLTGHRNYMVQLTQYMTKWHISKALQFEVIEHVEHAWRQTHGVTTNKLIELLHRPLQMDFVFCLYHKTLECVPVFDQAGHTFYRLLGIGLEEKYFREGASVIQLNDIVHKVFIVHKGQVEVTGPDGSVYTTLLKGSMFGNIDNVECTRSMITITAKKHLVLLAIETKDLYKLFHGFEHLFNRLQHYILLNNFSYIESSPLLRQHSAERETTKRELAVQSVILKLIHAEYLITIQVIFMHVLPCVLSSYYMAFETYIHYNYVLYATDFMHVLNVIYYFYRPYYNERAEIVLDTKLIRKRYLRSFNFYLDIITVPPYDIIAYFLPNFALMIKVLTGYRILRIVNVYRCFETTSSTFGSKVIIFRMAKLITYLCVIVHLCACWMYSFGCPAQRCQLGYWVYNRRRYVCGYRYNFYSYICALDVVVSTLSTTGFGLRVPTSIQGILVCILLVTGSTYLQGTVSGDIIALLKNATYNLQVYSFELQVFMTYLENGYISPPFIAKMRKYCVFLWVFGKGRQVPQYIHTLPDYLDEKIKVEAFGMHIYNNIIFANCHRDFLRMLIKKLNMLHFLPDDTICHQEDINNTMFFIHSGGVNVYTIEPTEEIHVDELKKLDSFGLIQGLYPNTPHTHTFKANAITCILTLTYEDWSMLLRFYPASKFEIYSNMTILFETAEEVQPTKPVVKHTRKKPGEMDEKWMFDVERV